MTGLMVPFHTNDIRDPSSGPTDTCPRDTEFTQQFSGRHCLTSVHPMFYFSNGSDCPDATIVRTRSQSLKNKSIHVYAQSKFWSIQIEDMTVS
jgi:hypothetical protein